MNIVGKRGRYYFTEPIGLIFCPPRSFYILEMMKSLRLRPALEIWTSINADAYIFWSTDIFVKKWKKNRNIGVFIGLQTIGYLSIYLSIKDSVYTIIVAESQKLQLTNWRPTRASGIILVQIKGKETKRRRYTLSLKAWENFIVAQSGRWSSILMNLFVVFRSSVD